MFSSVYQAKGKKSSLSDGQIFQSHIPDVDVLMLMNVENSSPDNLSALILLRIGLQLRSAAQVDTGYASRSRVIRATYLPGCEIECLDQSLRIFILKTQNTSLYLSKMVKD